MKNFKSTYPKLKFFLGAFFLLIFVSVSFSALTLTTPIAPQTADNMPSFGFSSDAETWVVTYAWWCTWDIASISNTGDYTVTYNSLSDWIYNCSIIISGVTLGVNEFEVDTAWPSFIFNDASSSENTTWSLSVTAESDVWVWLHATPYNYSIDWTNRGGWTTTNEKPLSLNTEPGSTTIRAKVRDTLWNETTDSAIYTWTNIAPTANAVSNSADEGSTVLLTSSVSDPWTTTHTYQRYSDNSCSSLIWWATGSTYTAPIQNEPISINYSYKTYDARLLESSCAIATATRNNVAPTMSTLTNHWSVDENSQLTWTAAGSDIWGWTIEYEFYNWSCGGTILQAYSSTDTYNHTLSEPWTLTIYARSKDTQWLESSCLSSVWTWDNVAPTANAVSNSADEGSTVLLTSSVSDPWTTTHTYQRYSDNSCSSLIWWATGSTYTAPIQNEPTSLDYYYKTYDARSWWSTCATATATRNNVNPSVWVINDWSRNETDTITWTATPSDPGWSTYTYQRYSDFGCSSSIIWQTSATTQATLSDQGTEQRYIIVTDNDGWDSSCQWNTATRNNVAPTANDFTLSASVWSSTVTWDWEIMSSASDIAGINDPLTATIQTQATKWTCSILSNVITYSPANNQIWNDSCVVRIDDGDSWTIDITVVLQNIDTSWPILAEVTPVTTPINDVTPNYTFSATEWGSIVYGWDCSSAVPTAIWANNTITLNTLSEWTHTNCTIRVVDSYWNTGNTLDISDFTIDITKPTASVSYNPNTLTNTDVLATMTASESVTVDSISWTTYNFVLDGTHLFEFTDTAGNTWETLATVNRIDKILPDLTGSSTITTSNADTSFAKVWDVITVTFSVTETLIQDPSVNVVWWWSFNLASKIWNTYSYNRSMDAWDPNWIINISVAMEDLATNVNSDTIVSTITFDKTNPAGIIITSPSNDERIQGTILPTYTKTLNIIWNIGSEINYGTNPIQIQYSSDWDFTNKVDISTGTENDWSYSWTIPDNYNTDTAMIRVIATDRAGNSTTFNSNSFNIDSIRPTEVIINTPDWTEYLKWWDEYSIVYVWWHEDNRATQAYWLSYNGWWSSQAIAIHGWNMRTVPSNINRQDVIFNINITDKAWWENNGNSNPFTIDNTDPGLSFNNSSARRNTSVNWTTTVSDNFALRLTWNNAVYKSSAFTDSCAWWTLTVPTYSTDWTYTSYACIEDRAWNITTWQQIYNIDKTNPFVDAWSDKITNTWVSQWTVVNDILSWWVISDIASVVWTKVSWPWVVSFNPTNTWNTTISAGTDGTYLLRLTATDNAWNITTWDINFTRDTVDPIITGLTVINTNTSSPWYSFESNEVWAVSYSGLCSNWSLSAVSIGTNTFNYSSRSEKTYDDCQLIINDLAGNTLVHNVPTFTVNIPSGGGWWWWGWWSSKDDCRSSSSDLPWANEDGEDYSSSKYDKTCLADEEDEEEEEDTEEEGETEEGETEETTVVLYWNDKTSIFALIEIPNFDDSKFENSMWVISEYIADKVSKKSIPVSELSSLIAYYNTFLSKFADFKNDWNQSAQDEAVVALSTFMSKLNKYEDAGSIVWWDELSMAIQFLYNNGLTKFSSKDTFRPDALITREQAAKFIVVYAEKLKWVTPDSNKTYVFADINDGDPTLKDYVLKSYQMWIFNWYGSVFKPHRNLTKWWALAVLLRVYLWDGLSEYNYPRYKDYYNKALELWLTADQNIRSWDNDITRGELALFIYRLSQK